jgi:hypothetical protein
MPPKRTFYPATFGAETPQSQKKRGRKTVAQLDQELKVLRDQLVARQTTQDILEDQLAARNNEQVRLELKEPKFRSFDGKDDEDPVAWFKDFQGVAQLFNMASDHQLIFLRRHITVKQGNI